MGQVAFRRIHGRVIPIHDKNEITAKDAAKATAKTGAALGLTALAGNVAGDLTHKAGLQRNAGMRAASQANKILEHSTKAGGKIGEQISMFAMRTPHVARRFMEKSEAHFNRSDKLLRRAGGVKVLGRAAAFTLASHAAYGLLDKTKYKNDQTKKAAIASTAGAASTFAVHHFYANRLTYNRSFRKAFALLAKTATKAALKKL